MPLLRFSYVISSILCRASLLFSAAALSNHEQKDHGVKAAIESRQVSGFVGAEIFMRRAYQASSSTLSIDLCQNWTNETVVFHSTNKPPSAPDLSITSLWYDEDNNIFYLGFTGRASRFGDWPETPPLSLWSFRPDDTGSGSWKEEIGTADPAWNHLTRTFGGYTAAGSRRALVLSGTTQDLTAAGWPYPALLPGIVHFDMTTKEFANKTATGFNPGGRAIWGRMQYVPSFGSNGLFLLMGGDLGGDGTTNILFDNIWVYDAETNQWYNQTATGNIPEPRREFCIAGVNSTNETYEIFLYGGSSGDLGSPAIPFDEIFILSLPAFHWFKVDYPPQHPRQGHSCNAVGGSQILSIGGIDSNSKISTGDGFDITKSTFNSSADPFTQGLGIFDMTSLKWADRYTANAPAMPSLPEADQAAEFCPVEKRHELYPEPVGPAEMEDARPEMGEDEVRPEIDGNVVLSSRMGQ
ncbi:MAG: hypothetical protein Q9179_001168 [Wetmoreana sp. 5 TL-2023]